MKPEKLEQALNYIRDVYIEEAAAPKKRTHIKWVGALAAVLALVMLVHTISPIRFDNAAEAPKAEAPVADNNSEEDKRESPVESIMDQASSTSNVQKYAVTLASTPRVAKVPDYTLSDEEFQQEMALWREDQNARSVQLTDALQNLEHFFTESSNIFLQSEAGENRVWSPVNGYIALAMLAETTSGTSRQQILDVLNTEDLDTLREQVSAVWESVYIDSEEGVSILSNSLWLDNEISYQQEALDNLSYYHYASTYYGDLGSEEMNTALQAWLSEQTGGLLEDHIDDVELSPESVLALASTVHLRSYWSQRFDPELNTQGTFHTPNGDVAHIFMNRYDQKNATYYRGENFGAVYLPMTNGPGIWLFLPDEDVEVSQLAESGEYMTFVRGQQDASASQLVTLNLSVPKFDIDAESDLISGLQAMGITDVFSSDTADFSVSVDTDIPVYVGSTQQAIRVSIDEEGLKAAGYTYLVAPGSAEPQEFPIVDFILDRPFLFVIERSDLPIFTGIVNEP